MSDIIGFDITPDSGSTLRKVLKFNLKPHMDEFEGISGGASKVMKLLMLIITIIKHLDYLLGKSLFTRILITVMVLIMLYLLNYGAVV